MKSAVTDSDSGPESELMKIYRLRLRSKLPTPADSNSDSDSDSAALLVTVGSLATHQILAQFVNRIMRYGDGGMHVRTCRDALPHS